ncbi:helix-turn-helix transcriptional regulator [Cyclobacterium xiamenense]|uniref:helix-turn-helix transcriptional regulator n=1 Tax=Cyclobacterium xiamenense TaxID=1297121 RepID=UPI0035CF3D09
MHPFHTLVFFLLGVVLGCNPLPGKGLSRNSLRVLPDQSKELACVQSDVSRAYARAADEPIREMSGPALKSEAVQVVGYSWFERRKLRLARDLFLEVLRLNEAAELGELSKKNDPALRQPASFYDQTALDLVRKQNRKPEPAIVPTNRAILAFEQGKPALADTLFRRSLALREEIGKLPGLEYTHCPDGKLAQSSNRSEEASQRYQKAISYTKQGWDLPGRFNPVNDYSEQYFRTDNPTSYRNRLQPDEKLIDRPMIPNQAKNITRSGIIPAQDADFIPPQTGTSSPAWVQRLLAGLALVSLLLLGYLYYRLRIKENVIRAVGFQLMESRKRQERLNQQLLAYSDRLASSVSKNKQLLQQLNQSSATSARQEALEALSRFRISKTEDLRTFRLLFEKAFPGYWDGLPGEIPDLTENERMVAALFKLGYTTQEMATVLGISYESTKKARYRLKKKVAARAGQPVLTQLSGMVK